jgi:hypothetical protein
MNLRTPFNLFVLIFHTNWQACTGHGKDYTFEALCGLLIIDKHILLEEGNIGGKHQAHLLNGKSKMDPRDRVWFDASTHKPAYHDQKPQRQKDAPQGSQKKKNTCYYCGNSGHVEKVYFKKRDELKEKVKFLEGYMFVVRRPTNKFTFQVKTSQAFLSHSAQNKWVVNSMCTHHMDKDASLFMWLDEA